MLLVPSNVEISAVSVVQLPVVKPSVPNVVGPFVVSQVHPSAVNPLFAGVEPLIVEMVRLSAVIPFAFSVEPLLVDLIWLSAGTLLVPIIKPLVADLVWFPAVAPLVLGVMADSGPGGADCIWSARSLAFIFETPVWISAVKASSSAG